MSRSPKAQERIDAIRKTNTEASGSNPSAPPNGSQPKGRAKKKTVKRAVKTTRRRPKGAPTKKAPSVEPPEFFYCSYNGKYYKIDAGGYWIAIPTTSVTRDLKRFYTKLGGKATTAAERAEARGIVEAQVGERFTHIEEKCNVWYAGSVAGLRRGVHIGAGNKRLLITDEATLIEPAAGDFPTIRSLVEGLFSTEPAAVAYVYAQLALSVRALYEGTLAQGQAVVLCGPADTGKTFLIQKVLVPILGGRKANPYQYASGRSQFNDDIIGSEVLVIDDEAHDPTHKARAALGQLLKSLVVTTDGYRVRGMYRGAVNIDAWWRLFMACNDDPDALEMLPDFGDNLADKFHFFHAATCGVPSDPDEYAPFAEKVKSELPAFVNFLVKHEIPEEMVDRRFGIHCYHSDGVRRAIFDASQAARLNEVITAYLTFDAEGRWKGPARQLLAALTEDEGGKRDMRMIAQSARKIGTLLADLHKAKPERVRPVGKLDGIMQWEITGAPSSETF